MNTLAIILVVISAVMHAVRNFFTKKADDKQIFVWLFELFSLILFLPVFIYFIIKEGIKNPAVFYICLASGLIHFLYWIFYSKSYETGDLSRVYPIMRSSPALVLILSVILLKEQPTALGVLGIIAVAIGIYIINMKKLTKKELLEPIKLIAKDRATKFAFITLLSVTAYSLVDKIGVRYADPSIFLFLYLFAAFILCTPYIAYSKNKSLIKKEWSINKKSIVASGFLAVFGYYLVLIAFTLEKLSYVIGLRQLSIVFAVLMGSHLLKEKHKLIRFSAAALIFIGAFLISIAK